MFRKLRKKIAQRSNKKTGERSRTPQAKSGRFGPMAIEPLEQRLVLDSTVVFNEVMYHPGDAADGVVDGIESLEWIELYNQLAVDMDLSEWEIDGIRQMNPDGTLSNYMFPEGTVIPGRGYLVVAKDPGKLQAATGYTDALGGFLGSLANDGEELRLINNDERVLNVLNYNDAGDWPAGADGSGASLAKDNPQTATQPAENWTVSMEIGGTPGYENFPRVFEPIGGGTPLALDAPWQIDTSGTDLGTAWREPAYDDSGWTTFRADSPSVLITEVGTSTPDWAEIQCVAPEQIDTAGWILAASGSRTDINEVYPALHELPATMEPGEVLYRNDDSGSNSYWGGNIPWSSSGPGWILMLDGQGNVADFIVWEFDDDALASFDVTVNGHRVTIEDAWAGSSYMYPEDSPRSASIQRLGTADHNSAVDFVHIEDTEGVQNADLVLPFTTQGIPLAGGTTTHYMRTEFNYDAAPKLTELAMDLLVDDGAIFYLNGQEIYRHNMPGGDVSFSTLAAGSVGTATFIEEIDLPAHALVRGTNVLAVEVHQAASSDTDGTFDMKLMSTLWPAAWATSEVPLAFNEVEAVDPLDPTTFQFELINYGLETLQLDEYAVTGQWDVEELDGTTTDHVAEFTLPAVTLAPGEFLVITPADYSAEFAPTKGARLFLRTADESIFIDAAVVDDTLRGRSPDGMGDWWYPDSSTFGSTNTFDFHDEIVINEIMYHHHPFTNPTGPLDEPAHYEESDEQWIELYNRSDVTVDLSGWRFSKAIRYTIPAGTELGPGEYLVVARDAEAMRILYEDDFADVASVIIGDFSGSLRNSDERILLTDAVGNIADDVHYYEGGQWAEYADGGGSSLELRDPEADNSKGAAWAASNERDKAPWQTFTYRGEAKEPMGSVTTYNELILGMLDAGEVLIDDVSVVRDPDGSPAEMMQNGSFEGDAIGSSADGWLPLGNHHGSVVVDPFDANNHALHITADGAQQYVHDYVQTVFAGNTAIQSNATYEISFRAKWLAGSPQINSRLSFNRLSDVAICPTPLKSGTPGMENSTLEANIGPTYADFGHSPILPTPDEKVTVTVDADDPDGVASMTLYWRIENGGWNTVAMTLNADGLYSGKIPEQSSGQIIQFYVRGVDTSGGVSTFPADGAESRALYTVDDGRKPGDRPIDTFRMVMFDADNAKLFRPLNSNEMSNAFAGGTVIHTGSFGAQAFYDVDYRQIGSRYIRPNSGYKVNLNPDDKFYGVHKSIRFDIDLLHEVYMKQMVNRAGGSSVSMYNDISYLVSPRHGARNILLQLTRYEDVFLDEQFENGGDGTKWELDDITFPTNPSPSPAGPKTGTGVSAQDIRYRGDNPENYRGQLLIKNRRAQDNYEPIVQLAEALNMTGQALYDATNEIMDVDLWMRHYATQAFLGNWDTYGFRRPKNLRIYLRPEDGKIIPLFWDADRGNLTDSLIYNGGDSRLDDIRNLPANERLFWGHMWDLVEKGFNREYIADWTTHYGQMLGTSLSGELNKVGNRANQAKSQALSRIPQVPFEITTNNGNALTVDSPVTTIQGTAWINAREIHINGSNKTSKLRWVENDTWEFDAPLAVGQNTYTFEAYDFDGQLIGTKSIQITSTATERPLADNLRITEINYNPSPLTPEEIQAGFTDPSQFEFIEIQNIGDEPLHLSDVHFESGLDYTFTSHYHGTPLMISEIGTATPDFAEIQSVAEEAVNTAGWFLVANQGSAGINGFHEPWMLPDTVGAGDVLYVDDNDDGSYYWGNDQNISWRGTGDGWLALVDNTGNVVDFVAWGEGYDEATLATLDVTVNGAHITTAGNWTGPAASKNLDSRHSIQRSGDADHNDGSDWASLEPDTPRSQNAGIVVPFAGTGPEIQAGEIVVLASNRAAFEYRYGASGAYGGQFAGQLSDDGERILLVDQDGGVIADFRYGDSNDGGWPNRADGKGSTLELIDPMAVPSNVHDRVTYLENGDNWRSSSEYLGTPGTLGLGAGTQIVINEVLTHTDYPEADAIELHNLSDADVMIGGWWLSDTNDDYAGFQIPEGTVVSAGGYIVFYEGHYVNQGGEQVIVADADEFGGEAGFGLNGAHGDNLWLTELDEVTVGEETTYVLRRVVDSVDFDAAANGETVGRYTDSNDEVHFYPMTVATLGSENSSPRVGPLVISEIMYKGIDPDGAGTLDAEEVEYIEIFNPTAMDVDLTDWRIEGHKFDDGQMIGAGETLVILSYDPHNPNNSVRWQTFAEHYGLDPADKAGFVGGFDGKLSNSGEGIKLQRPDEPPLDEPNYTPRLLEDHVIYSDMAPWAVIPDGDGSSLHRTAATSWGRDAASWVAAEPTPGTVDLDTPMAQVVGRHVFYNDSAFDGVDATPNAADDGAIATDKTALLPGQTATTANYTSYAAGINGLMIDIANLGTIDASDLEFRVGNSNDPSTWTNGPTPSDIAVRQGAGINGSDRVTMVWPNGSITGEWVQVTVLAGATNGLGGNDVFYFGNAVGEAGDNPDNAMVTVADEIMARNFRHGLANPAAINDPVDFNRDRVVNMADRLIARSNRTGMLDSLRLIDAPAVGGLAVGEMAIDGAFAQTVDQMGWVSQLDDTLASGDSSGDKASTESAVDKLLESFGL